MQEYKTVGELVRITESNYVRGVTQISKYVSYSMFDTLEKIEAYFNSTHINGDYDAKGNKKPFFNISIAAVNIWYRATDIDRKDIKFYATNNESVVLAFVANIILQKWMNDNRFGQFLNTWGRTLAKYGSAVVKSVRKNGELHLSITPWGRLISDSVDFAPNAKIELLELTEAQLTQRIKTNGYNADQVKALSSALKARETVDKRRKDNKSQYIKLYEIHGNLPKSYLTKNDKDQDTYVQQMHVVSYVGSTGRGKSDYQDFTLYAGEEAKDPYMITHLIKEDARSLAIGAVESLFMSQWMTNHSKQAIKNTLDVSSRLILQTADNNFIGRNVLQDFQDGDIFIHAATMPLTKIDNTKLDVTAWENYAIAWQNIGQQQTATPDATRGVTPISGTPYSTTALLTQQSNSLFEIMTENKGLHIEDLMNEFIIPYVKTQLKNKDQVVAILEREGIQEIDALYIPQEAIKRFNAKTIDAVLTGATPSPYQPHIEQQQLQQQLAQQGNKRFFKPDELDKKTWADLFSDFEWESIRVDVTNEQVDKQAALQTLNTVFQTIASNPTILENPNAMAVFSTILREVGTFSPLELSSASSPPTPLPKTELREVMNFADLPPDGKQQMAAKAGLQIQLPQPTPAASTGALPVKK